MVLNQPLNRRLYLNNCSLKTAKNGKKYYCWYTSLGKGKDIITCKCWNLEHDMTKLKYIEKCIVDLSGHKYNGVRYYELQIKAYAKPTIESWKVVQPKDKEKVNVNDEIPPMEEFGEQIIDTPDIQELVDNYKKE